MPARTINHGAEIREVYLMAFDSNGTDPVTVEQETEGRINVRFAREILGLLTKKKIVVLHEVGGEDLWQTELSQDNASRDEAEAFIDQFLGLGKPKPVPAKQGGDAKKDSTAKPESGHACYCGCGEVITSRAFYRPGHDARHAGVTGRRAAELDPESADYYDLYNELPSTALVEKAKRIEETTRQKQAKKDARSNSKVEAGVVTYRKKTFPAVRYPDGKVVYTDPVKKTEHVAGPKTVETFKTV